MIRTLALATTALTVLGLSPAAAACVKGPDGTFVCTGDDGVAINDARDAVAVIVEAGATLSAPTRPIELGGDNAAVVNSGEIVATSEANNTVAIVSTGANLSITNSGRIDSGDRAVEVLGGPGGLTVVNSGDITSRRQAIRALEQRPGTMIVNSGLIEAEDGRAAQVRGAGSSVTNSGVMRGGEEVIEGREDFFLANSGLIAIRGLSWDAATRTWTDAGAPIDEDGVQIASGVIDNSGVILSTDDGVDTDEGVVINRATGVIISAAPDDSTSSGGIDVDARFEPSTGSADFRPAGPLRIENAGYIEGPRAIATDDASESTITIFNSGVLFGRGGVAIGLAPGQGDSTLDIFGASEIIGDVLFGAGDDRVTIQALTSGVLGTGVFDGGAGVNTVAFGGAFAFDDLTTFMLTADLVSLSLRNPDGSSMDGLFRNFAFWELEGVRYDTDTLAALKAVAPVPLPAALPMLAVALGGLALMRRRARS